MIPTPHIARATRNAIVLHWWQARSSTFRSQACAQYALHLGCPTCEVCEEMGDRESIEWVWGTYGVFIRADAAL